MTTSTSKPYFSVVVPVYNKEPYVRRSITSILAQTFPDFELILVNDASTDGSLDRILEFDDPRIRILHRSIRGPGGYAARNLGIDNSRGTWIAFLDADDEFYSDHLETMRHVSEEFPECEFLSCGWRTAFADGSTRLDPYTEHFKPSQPREISFIEYLQLCVQGLRPTASCTVCIKNTAIAKNLFPAGRVERGGDQHAWRSYLARCKSMAVSSHVGAIYYRDVLNSTTRLARSSPELAKNLRKDFGAIVSPEELRLLKKYSNRTLFDEWIWDRLRDKTQYSLGSAFYWSGDLYFCISRYVVTILPLPTIRLLLTTKSLLRSVLTLSRNRRKSQPT